MRLLLWISLVCLAVSVGAVTDLSGVYGTFESPNFPTSYGNDFSKEWRIRVREGYKIKFKFTAFDLEDSYDVDLGGACVYDYVKITEAGEDPIRFCGKARYHYDAPSIGHWYESKGNNITVTFVTDYSNEGISPTGFAVHYIEADIDECAKLAKLEQTTFDGWDELITCNHFCVNVPGTYYCDCRAGFELAPNKHTCVAKFCENQRLTAVEGTVESPDYPNQYGKLSNCRWDINVPKGHSIQLRFDETFDIEEHYEEGCVYDYLTINYKDHSDRYCGNITPNANETIDLNTKDAQIQFHSDISIEKIGFRIHYNTIKIRCLKQLQAPTDGSMSSNNAKSYFEFGDHINFACNRGYEMEGSQITHCNNEGEWTHAVPKCKIISCGPPDHLSAVRYKILDLTGKTFEYSEEVTLSCIEWYEQTAGYATWKCEYTKQWIPKPGSRTKGSQDIPICRPICGRRLIDDRKTFSPYTSGGKAVALAGGWPWMAFVDRSGQPNGRSDQYCGGTLVDEMTVVTAGHCIADINPQSDITVWLGLLNRTEAAAPYNFTQSFTVSEDARFIHESFATKRPTAYIQYYDNDVAVLKLDRRVDLSYHVRPICLPFGVRADQLLREFRETRSKKAIATGWGVTEGGKPAEVLRKTRLSVVSMEDCRRNFEDTFSDGQEMITDNMICAGLNKHVGPSNRISDTCKYDSGGPLMTKTGRAGRDKDAVWYLSGITSFGDERPRSDGSSRCGHGETYGVYTDVGKVLDFIQLHLEQFN